MAQKLSFLPKRKTLSAGSPIFRRAIRPASPSAAGCRAGGAWALRARAPPPVAPLLQPEKDILELVHPGVGEQYGGVVLGKERGAGNDLMVFPGEEAATTPPALHG